MSRTITSNARRSKSISRTDYSLSRTSSVQQDSTQVNSSRTRQSAEGPVTPVSGSILGRRSSVEKGRIRDQFKGHRKSESLRSDISKFTEDGASEVSPPLWQLASSESYS